jgi:putative FmdB family regulatory protein
MPIYEYKCKKCAKKFTLTLTISEHDTKRIRCPKCSSTLIEQQFAEFFAVTSKKS